MLEAKEIITDGANEAGWSLESQIDILADFINSKDLEKEFKRYVDEQVAEEQELEDEPF